MLCVFSKPMGQHAQFEAGQQKGGHYFCWTCDIHYSHVKDMYVHHIFIIYSSYMKIYLYQDRQKKIIKTSGSRKRSRGGSDQIV